MSAIKTCFYKYMLIYIYASSFYVDKSFLHTIIMYMPMYVMFAACMTVHSEDKQKRYFKAKKKTFLMVGYEMLN